MFLFLLCLRVICRGRRGYYSDNLQDSSKPEAGSCFIIDFECVSRARGQLQPAQPGKFSAPHRCFITIR